MGVLPQTPLVGRADELAALRRAVTASWAGRGTTVVLSGEAGIGKTRLVSELLEVVPGDRAHSLVGTCSTLAAREVPWAPWRDAVRELRRFHGDELISALLADRLPLLAPVAPGLVPPGQLSAQPPVAQLYGAMTDLLLGVADSSPLLVVLEDVQWADGESLALLLHLTRSARSHPMAVVVTARTEDPAYERVRDRVLELERLPGTVRMDLGPLGPEDAAAHARHVSEGRLDPGRLDQVVELSGGVPLFVEELVAAVERGGAVVAPRALQERLLRLSPQARGVVECLALAVTSPPAALLLRASGLDGAAFDEALAECLASAVLVERGGRLDFRHALLREGAAGLLLPHRSQDVHRSWARALQESPAEDDRALERAVGIAHHWRAAADTVAAFDACLCAAELARRVSAYSTRLQLLQEAVRLWPAVPDAEARAGEDLAALLTDAALAARSALTDPHQCLALLTQARQVLLAAGSRPDESARLAWLDLLDGRCRDRFAEYQSAEETLARLEAIPREPPTQAWVLAATQAGDVLGQAGRPEQGEPYVHDAVHAARILRDPALESRATIAFAFNQLHLGRTAEALRRAQAATRLAEQAGELEALHDALIGLQAVYWYLGDLDGTVRITLRDLDLLGGDQPGPLPTAWGLQRTNLADAMLDLGQWDEAEALLSSVLARQDMPPFVSAFAGRLWRHLGTWRRSGDYEHRPCVDPGGLGDIYLQDLVPIHYTAADQAAAAGDVAGVRALVREVLADDRTAAMSPVVLPLLEVAARAEAEHARAGRTDPDAATGRWTLDQVRHFLTLLPPGNPRDCAYVAQVRAELLRRDGADDAATWSGVVDRWRKTPMPHRLAWSLVRFADAAAADQRHAAIAALKEATAIADRLDADPLRHAVASIGRRVGVHVGPAGRDVEVLTSREHEVLQLLAAGASNAAIAEALVISPKTVAVHVSHILAKLGVTSRGAAVAAALRTGIAHLDGVSTG